MNAVALIIVDKLDKIETKTRSLNINPLVFLFLVNRLTNDIQ